MLNISSVSLLHKLLKSRTLFLCLLCKLLKSRIVFLYQLCLQYYYSCFILPCIILCLLKAKFTMFLLSVWRKAKYPSFCCSSSPVWDVHVIQSANQSWTLFSFSLHTPVSPLIIFFFLRIFCFKKDGMWVMCVYVFMCMYTDPNPSLASISRELIIVLFLALTKP